MSFKLDLEGRAEVWENDGGKGHVGVEETACAKLRILSRKYGNLFCYVSISVQFWLGCVSGGKRACHRRLRGGEWRDYVRW